jgi:hypothetical protein
MGTRASVEREEEREMMVKLRVRSRMKSEGLNVDLIWERFSSGKETIFHCSELRIS